MMLPLAIQLVFLPFRLLFGFFFGALKLALAITLIAVVMGLVVYWKFA